MRVALGTALVCALGIVGIWWFIAPRLEDNGHTAIGALFTGLAFGGLVLTTLLQRRDIREAKAAQTRAEILSSGSAIAASIQTTAAQNQEWLLRLTDADVELRTAHLTALKNEIEKALTELQSIIQRNSSAIGPTLAATIPDWIKAVMAHVEEMSKQLKDSTEEFSMRSKLQVDLLEQLGPLLLTLANLYNVSVAKLSDKDAAEPTELIAAFRRHANFQLR